LSGEIRKQKITGQRLTPSVIATLQSANEQGEAQIRVPEESLFTFIRGKVSRKAFRDRKMSRFLLSRQKQA
jgi:hypothetical protein